MPDASAKPAGRGLALLLEALALNLLLAASAVSALDSHYWAGLPVWPAPWVLVGWYLARLFLAWRGGGLGHFLRWHLLALVPATAASAIGTIVALPFAIPLLGEAADAGPAGIILLALAVIPFMYAYFIALPAGVWVTRRWLPGRPAFARAWRDTMLGLTGLSLVTAAPMLGVHWLAERAPMPEPVVVVHPAASSPGIRWMLAFLLPEQGRYKLEQCRQTGSTDINGMVSVTGCHVVGRGHLFKGNYVRSWLFDPARLLPILHAQGGGLFLCQGDQPAESRYCRRVWIPATPAADSSNWPRDSITLGWELVVQPPRLPDGKPSDMRIEACKPAWLPRERGQCVVVSGILLPASGRGVALVADAGNLFHPRDPRLRQLLADPGHGLYLHVLSEQGDAWSRFGVRPAQPRDDYYPLRIPPFPGKDKRGGSAQ